MAVEITVEDDRWTAFGLEQAASSAVIAVLDRLGLDPDGCEVSLLGCNDPRIAALNTEFRGKAVPTNVLSWPAADLASDSPGGAPARPEPDFAGETVLGDIAIAWETCVCEAEEQGKPLGHHVTHLIVHGLLHLLGYDHIRDPDATLMETLETEILGNLGMPDPYRED